MLTFGSSGKPQRDLGLGRCRCWGGKARTELREEREVEAELLDEPINGRAASLRENLRDSGRVSVSDRREARGSEVKYLATRARSGFVRKKEAAFRGAPPGRSRTFARGMVCAGAEVWPTPAAPLMISASNLSALSSMPALACVRVSAPLIPDVAFVLLPPRKGHLSRSRTRPPCSRTVCTAESPARPPPTTMTCSAMTRVSLLRKT